MSRARVLPVVACLLLALCGGCATPSDVLYSVEWQDAGGVRPIQEKAALLPPMSPLPSPTLAGALRRGLDAYAGATEGVLAVADCERALEQDAEAKTAYCALASSLLGFLPPMVSAKGDRVCKIESEPWDGEKGLNYTNLVALYGLPGHEGYKPENLRLDWQIWRREGVPVAEPDVEAAKSLGTALDCRYLVVPVVHPRYKYERVVQFFLFIPLFYVTQLGHDTDYTLFLVDADTGGVPVTLSCSRADALSAAVSAQRLLGKGVFAGSVQCPEPEP